MAIRRGTEKTTVWHPLKKEFDRLHWHYQRLENQAVAPGVPDVNVHIPDNGDVWIEMKHVEIFPALEASINLGLRREQYIWLRAAKEAGRSCYLLARIGAPGVRYPEPNWWLWEDPEAWALARYSCSWEHIKTLGQGFIDLASLTAFLLPSPRQRETV